MRLHGKCDIFESGEVMDSEVIWNERASRAGSAIDGKLGNVGTIEVDRASLRDDFAAQQADERGLAGSVRTDHGMNSDETMSSVIAFAANTPPKRHQILRL